jgi:alpha-N-acetylglucosaminidase
MRIAFAVVALCQSALIASAALAADPTASARDVLVRCFGPRAAEFRLETIPAEAGRPVFEIAASNGTVTIRGSSGVALSRGAYTYLRAHDLALFTWGGRQLNLPARWPDHPHERIVAPFRHLMQDNICTPGYTTAYYGWPEWERYLDVMALHGFNLTMAPLGGEAIWARVWKQFGLTDAELADFFTGPAFLPWHRMGNVNKHGGPLPAAYLEQSVALQKQLLARMRELGIEPVAPAFSGFVPAGFTRAQPDAQVLDMHAWCGFGGAYGSHMLHPLSPLYPAIGGAFIKEWQKEFGDADFYQADSFNEMSVPVSGDRTNQLAQLAAFGDSVYSAIKAGDPDGTWVMMAWAFLSGFWTPDNTQALLSKVPDDRMLILDLFCEKHPQWNRLHAYFGKPWTFGVLPNFGGNSQYIGHLGYLARTLPALTNLANRGNLSAFGYFPEGTENNEVLYELASDAIWSSRPLEVDAWLQGYGRARYGALPAPVREAWTLLAQSVYARGDGSVNQRLQRRPAGRSYGALWTGDAKLQQAADLLLQAAPELKDQTLYRNDAIEVAAQALGMLIDRRLEVGQAALAADAKEDATRCFREATALMADTDRLLASHTLWRLDRWVGLARAWGRTPAEQDYFEQDAKRQVTLWGRAGGAQLSEYAAKLWSGLVGGYYQGRWAGWSAAQLGGAPFDQTAWEERWVTTPGGTQVTPWPDPLARAVELLAVGRVWDNEEVLCRARGIEIGQWKSGEMTEQYADREWPAPALAATGTHRIRFAYTGGSHRLDIARVALLVNGAEIAADAHEGTTGVRNEGNLYTLEVKEPVPADAKVVLRARIKSAGGTDSNGTIYLRKN